jgi:hypothetical protein
MLVCKMWEELLNCHVKLRQKDGWCKAGLFLGEESGFARLKYDDGRIVFISLSEIVIMEAAT